MGCEASAETIAKREEMRDKIKAFMNKGKMTFSYFDVYGRGEPGRMMLAHAKVDYIDDRIANEDWPDLKKTKFAGMGLPVLTLPDGRVLDQSIPIYRLMAKQLGYYPTDVDVQAEHDWVVDNYVDAFGQIAPALFFEKDPAVKQ